MKSFLSRKIKTEVFYGESIKQAYLKACKWFASNVIANNKLNDVTAQYIKNENDNSVTLVLYAFMEENKEFKRRCEMCKEMHKTFFINEANNCNTCNVCGYRKQCEQKLEIKSKYYQEMLEK